MNRKEFHVIYNYDDPTRNALLVWINVDYFALIYQRMPCCDVLTEEKLHWFEHLLRGKRVAAVVVPGVMCCECNRTYKLCTSIPADQKPNMYWMRKDKGRMKILHTNKNL